MEPLKCNVMHIVRYIAYLGTLGTIKASSMQPYLSAINRLYMDHKLQQVALGPLVVDAVAGLAGMQQAIATSSRRAPLPAAVAKAFHDKAGGQAADISAPLLLFRNNLSTITSFMYFNRSDTTHSLHEGDLSVDPIENSDRQIRLFPRQRKGQKRVAATKIDAALIPVDAHPRFASMIIEFKRRRADAYVAAGVKPPLQLWAIPGDRPSTWTSEYARAAGIFMDVAQPSQWTSVRCKSHWRSSRTDSLLRRLGEKQRCGPRLHRPNSATLKGGSFLLRLAF
uniref:Uncharacterized protein n=1 Tax=Mantoniella antarctica TaxID=81844 RepID=A0A7S0SB51_9CHLO